MSTETVARPVDHGLTAPKAIREMSASELEAARHNGNGHARPGPGSNGFPPGEDGRPNVVALGHDGPLYYVLSDVTKTVQGFTPNQFNARFVQTLAPLDAWRVAFEGSRGGVDLGSALDWLIGECARKGVYIESRVRGPGAWRDGEHLVYHAGDRLVDPDTGTDRALGIEGPNVFEVGRRVELADAAALASDGMELLALCERIPWVNPVHARFLFGFLVLAPVCGALPWRPHVYIIGPSGTGKTEIVNHIVLPVLGEHTVTALSIQGPATEAGIRQLAKRAAMPVVWDECEDTTGRPDAMGGPMFLARQSSSNNAAVPKGTTSGRAIAYTFRLMFMFLSTTEYLEAEPDRNRMAVLSIKKDDRRRSDFRQFRQDARTLLTPAWCLRFHTRSVRGMRDLLRTVDVFRQETTDVVGNARAGDQYGTLLAGAWFGTHDGVPTDEEARDFATDAMRDFATTYERPASDAERCLRQIIGATVRLRCGERSVWELIAAASYPGSADNALDEAPERILRRYGIKMDSFKDQNGEAQPAAWFAREHPLLGNLAGGFRQIYGQRLRDIAAGPAENRWFEGRTIRALPVLLKTMERMEHRPAMAGKDG